MLMMGPAPRCAAAVRPLPPPCLRRAACVSSSHVPLLRMSLLRATRSVAEYIWLMRRAPLPQTRMPCCCCEVCATGWCAITSISATRAAASAHAAVAARAATPTRAPAPPPARSPHVPTTPGLPFLICQQAQHHPLNVLWLARVASRVATGALTRVRPPCQAKTKEPHVPPILC